MEKKFVANKALIVNAEGKILLLRDAGVGDHANAKGQWDVPGGRMEANETPQEALMREVHEEIGLEIDPALAQPFHVGLWGVGGDIVNNPVIGIFYIVPIEQTEVTLSAEHSEMIWVDPMQPLPGEMTGDIAEILEAYRRRIKRV